MLGKGLSQRGVGVDVACHAALKSVDVACNKALKAVDVACYTALKQSTWPVIQR